MEKDVVFLFIIFMNVAVKESNVSFYYPGKMIKVESFQDF